MVVEVVSGTNHQQGRGAKIYIPESLFTISTTKKHPTDIQTGCVDESLRAGSYPSYASAQPIGIEYTTEKSIAEQETRLRSLCYTSKQWG